MYRILALAAAGSITLGSLAVGGPATAATSDTPPRPTSHSTLAEIQAAGALQTSNRITALNSGIAKVTSTKTLTASDQATVLASLNADLNGMKTLQAKIAADTTAAAALGDYHAMFTEYRVYAVGLRQSFIAASADGLTGTAIPKLQSAAAKIAARFAADPSKVTPALRDQLADMQAKTADAVSKTSGLAAAALAVTPAAFNANHAVLTDLRDATRAARADSKTAVEDGRAIVKALR